MSLRNAPWLVLAFVLAVLLLLGLPLIASGYVLALAISMLELHRAGDGLGAVLRADELHLARHAPPSSASAPTPPP